MGRFGDHDGGGGAPVSSGGSACSWASSIGSDGAASRGQITGEGGSGGASRGEGVGDPSAPSSCVMQEMSSGYISFLRFRPLVNLGEVTRGQLLESSAAVVVSDKVAAVPPGAGPSAPSVPVTSNAVPVWETAIAAAWAYVLAAAAAALTGRG